MVARFVMKSNKKILFVLAILTMAIVLSFVFVACNKTDGKDPGDKDLIEPPKKELSASEIYRQVNPSVAFVLIENLSGYSSGSGFFIDSNGTLITNYHVIDDGLSGAIQLYDGTVATIDSVIGYDKKLDIAILSTSAKNTSPVKNCRLNHSDWRNSLCYRISRSVQTWFFIKHVYLGHGIYESFD